MLATEVSRGNRSTLLGLLEIIVLKGKDKKKEKKDKKDKKKKH